MDPEERSRLYDVISDPRKRLAHEGEFLKWLLEIAPGRRVLDVACGTGVHAQFLAQHGAAVTARDIDEDSIRRARQDRPHERLAYEVHDMREPRGGPFDLVMAVGNAISLVGAQDDVVRALKAISSMLSPGGLVFVQVFNYAALRSGGPKHKVARKKTPDGEIVVVKNMLPAEGAGALVSFSYWTAKNGLWDASGSQSVLPDLSRERFLHAVRTAGLAVKSEFGDYDRSPYLPDTSPDLLVILQK